MTQGLFFLVARWALGRSGPIGCDVRRHSGRRLVTATHRKIRNGKFQTEGLFRTIADNLNFRQAAEALYLTQPAVTLQIKALEEELGVALFDRTENSCALTEAGRILLKHAKKVEALTAAARQELARLVGEEEGDLFAGASTTISQYLL